MQLTRYEVAHIIGLRALQLSNGAESLVTVDDEMNARDVYYVAALELREKKLDMQVKRDGAVYHVTSMTMPSSVDILLDTKDGKTRSYRRSSLMSCP
jgi:DNA-directed RNA polymerase subunit K/omega